MLLTALSEHLFTHPFNSSEVANEFPGRATWAGAQHSSNQTDLQFPPFQNESYHTFFVTKVATKTKSDKVVKATWHSVWHIQ